MDYQNQENRLIHLVQMDRLKCLLLESPEKYEEVVSYFPMAVYVQRKDDLEYTRFNPTLYEALSYEKEAITEGGLKLVKSHIRPDNWAMQQEWVKKFSLQTDTSKCLYYWQLIKSPNNPEYRTLISYKKVIDTDHYLTLSFEPFLFEKTTALFKDTIGVPPFKPEAFLQYQSLTNMEKEVLKWIATGFTNKQIADKLFLSQHTIRTHRNRIWKKLDITHLRDVIWWHEQFSFQIR